MRAKPKEAQFDFSILSRQVTQEINREYEHQDARPPLNIVGKVGRSVFEVVGTIDELGANSDAIPFFRNRFTRSVESTALGNRP